MLQSAHQLSIVAFAVTFYYMTVTAAADDIYDLKNAIQGQLKVFLHKCKAGDTTELLCYSSSLGPLAKHIKCGRLTMTINEGLAQAVATVESWGARTKRPEREAYATAAAFVAQRMIGRSLCPADFAQPLEATSECKQQVVDLTKPTMLEVIELFHALDTVYHNFAPLIDAIVPVKDQSSFLTKNKDKYSQQMAQFVLNAKTALAAACTLLPMTTSQ